MSPRADFIQARLAFTTQKQYKSSSVFRYSKYFRRLTGTFAFRAYILSIKLIRLLRWFFATISMTGLGFQCQPRAQNETDFGSIQWFSMRA